MGKKKLSAVILSAFLLVLSACGSEEKATGDKKESKEETEIVEAKAEAPEKKETEKEADKEADKEQEEEKKKESAQANENEIMNPGIAKESEGDVEVVYTNTEPNISHDMEGFMVSVDKYQIVSVKNMHKSVTIPFDDEPDGYVITAQVTIENKTDKDLFFPYSSIAIQSKDQFDIASATRTFINEEDRINPKLETPGSSKYAAGEKVSGFLTFLYTNAEFADLEQANSKFKISASAADNDQFKNRLGLDGIFEFPTSAEKAESIAGKEDFYQDRIVTDNVAEKKMLFQKSDINKTEELNGVAVTVEGVQYTLLTPTESYKNSFSNFGDSGVIALTMKLNINNQSASSISSQFTSAKIRIDDNRATAFSAGTMEPRRVDEIKAGEESEQLFVFLFRKDEFDIFNKFDLEYGPIKDMDLKDISKGNSITFSIPKPKPNPK